MPIDDSGQGEALARSARADLERRFAETFLLLNQVAASLSRIERSCNQALDLLPAEDEAGVSRALALRTARTSAHDALEQIGDLADTLTVLLRFFAHDTRSGPGSPGGNARAAS